MFGWEFPPINSGGLGVACEGLTKALSSKDIKITFVLPKKLDLEVNFLKFAYANEIKNSKFIAINSEIISPYYNHINKLSKLSFNTFLDEYHYDILGEVLRYEYNSIQLAKAQSFDIIHAHDWLSFGAGIKAKEVSGKPLIAHIHATEFDRCASDNINQAIFEKEQEGFKKADKIIAVSNLTKKTVVERYGIAPEKVTVVHNGVEHEEINIESLKQQDLLHAAKESGYKIVLFLGRLTIQKNPDSILHAARKILKHHPKTIFVFAGSGDMERSLIEQAAHFGISDKVIFTGFVRGHQKHRLFRIADVFIMPSISEPFGIVSLEALINGTPVLVSKQSGVSEVLSHALKVDFWDIDEIVNKLYALFRYSTLSDTLKLNGHIEGRRYTWGNAAEKCINIYNELTV